MRVVVDQVTAGYDAPVLHDVSAVARQGAVTAVIGPNAAGKTTLLRCLVGVMHPLSGAVRVGDEVVDRMPPGARAARVAYVAQRSTVSAGFTVREVVELGRYALRRDTERVERALEQADVVHLADRRFAELSVGQQQRVMLARGLAQVSDDGVLVLDEPMAGLDLRHVVSVGEVLRSQAARGVTIIVAMHDLTMTARLADHVWLLGEGRLAVSGDVDEVMSPTRLSEVFGVGVERTDTAGGPVILPEMRLGYDS